MSSAHSPEALKALLLNRISLRQDLIQRVIERDFEGNTSAFGRSLELAEQPHYKTIFRWARQQQGLPKSPQRLLALAQALDVDPFLLLDIDTEILLKCCTQASWNLTWGSIHKALAFMNGLFSLTPEHWPPPDLAAYFDGQWYAHDFIHDPKLGRHYFQPHLIHPEAFYAENGEMEAIREPQTWYLAYRDISLKSGQPEAISYWRPFGMLWTDSKKLNLLQFSGLQEQVALPDPEQAFVFETFFGQGAAAFRIASLHPFEFSLPKDRKTWPCVRFGFPE